MGLEIVLEPFSAIAQMRNEMKLEAQQGWHTMFRNRVMIASAQFLDNGTEFAFFQRTSSLGWSTLLACFKSFDTLDHVIHHLRLRWVSGLRQFVPLMVVVWHEEGQCLLVVEERVGPSSGRTVFSHGKSLSIGFHVEPFDNFISHHSCELLGCKNSIIVTDNIISTRHKGFEHVFALALVAFFSHGRSFVFVVLWCGSVFFCFVERQWQVGDDCCTMVLHCGKSCTKSWE